MFGMLSVLAKLQRELIVANTRDRLAAARARGRTGGRRPRLNAGQVAIAQELYDAGDHTVQRIADPFNVPRTTVYGHSRRREQGQPPGHSGQTEEQRRSISRLRRPAAAGLYANGGW